MHNLYHVLAGLLFRLAFFFGDLSDLCVESMNGHLVFIGLSGDGIGELYRLTTVGKTLNRLATRLAAIYEAIRLAAWYFKRMAPEYDPQ